MDHIPEPQICDRIIHLGAFQTADSVMQALLLDAEIEALANKLPWRDTQNFFHPVRRKHDRQCSCKSVQEQCSSRFVSGIRRRLREFIRKIRKHMVSRILRRRRKHSTDNRGIDSFYHTVSNRSKPYLGRCRILTLTGRPCRYILVQATRTLYTTEKTHSQHTQNPSLCFTLQYLNTAALSNCTPRPCTDCAKGISSGWK